MQKLLFAGKGGRMTNHSRSAGYCIHCQRGVTVVRPTGNGFFGRVRTTLTNNEDSWVCSKCGKPATKGFAPQVSEPLPDNTVATAETHDSTLDSPAPQPTHSIKTERNDPALNNPEAFTVGSDAVEAEPSLPTAEAVTKLKDDPDRPAISKALCTLCQFEMTYPKKLTGKEVKCPSCNTAFQLP
jgi:hypothetical protein